MDNRSKVGERLNSINHNKLGEIFKIIRYKNARDIDVQFEDGSIVKNKKYTEFEKGSILKDNWIYKYLNEEKINNQGCLMKIININKKVDDIDIQFIDKYGYISKNKTYSNFKNGSINNPYAKTSCDVGYIGETNIEKTSYIHWHGMITRCYNKNSQKVRESYIGCSVCEEWLCYKNFKEWFNENYYEIKNEKMHLDKDILINNNKLYSKDTCLFVPERINALFSIKYKGDTLIGVRKHKDKFRTCLSKKTENIYLGTFETQIEAFQIYKKEKEKYVKEIAEEYKNKIPNKIYDALIKWELTL